MSDKDIQYIQRISRKEALVNHLHHSTCMKEYWKCVLATQKEKAWRQYAELHLWCTRGSYTVLLGFAIWRRRRAHSSNPVRNTLISLAAASLLGAMVDRISQMLKGNIFPGNITKTPPDFMLKLILIHSVGSKAKTWSLCHYKRYWLWSPSLGQAKNAQ